MTAPESDGNAYPSPASDAGRKRKAAGRPSRMISPLIEEDIFWQGMCVSEKD